MIGSVALSTSGRWVFFFLKTTLLTAALSAQSVITTLVGTDWIFRGEGRPATEAPLGRFVGVALDGEGRAVFADQSNHMVMRLERDGTLRVLAGNGLATFSGDGEPATQASLWSPSSVAYDRQGNLYVADTLNHRVRRVSPDGIITTVAGNGTCGFSGDHGLAGNAVLCLPYTVVVDSAGNVYVNDRGFGRIRRISPSGLITTIAGNGGANVTLSPTVPATQTALGGVESLAVSSSGHLVLAELNANAIRQWDASGNLTLLARMSAPSGVAFDREGNLWAASLTSHRLGRVRGGAFEPSVGAGTPGFQAGNSNTALFHSPSGFVFDSAGAVLLADRENFRLRRIVIGGEVTTLAGNGRFQAYDDGTPALAAYLNSPFGVAGDGSGLLIADNGNYRLRRASPSQVSTLAGNGVLALGDNGVPATRTAAVGPISAVADREGNVFYTDSPADVNGRGHVIRRVARNGQVTTVAGTGEARIGADGPASSTPLAWPWQLALDAQGRLLFAETAAHRIRILDGGQVRTLAGAADGAAGPAVDNVTATAARFNSPRGVAIDPTGVIYIGDTGNRVIRRLSNGVVTIVAGGGSRRLAPGQSAQAREVQLDQPAQIAVSPEGDVYFVDRTQHVVYRLSGGMLTVVAGSGRPGFAGDGALATGALLNTPNGVAVDSRGNLLIADTGNHRIRMVQPVAPSFSVTPANLLFQAKSSGPSPPPQTILLQGALVGMRFQASVQLSRGAGWLSLTAEEGVMPSELEVRVDPGRLPPGEYTATITLRSPGANPPARSVQVRLLVEAEEPPKLNVEDTRLEFAVKAGDAPQNGLITVRNSGGGELFFELTTYTEDGAPWLRATADQISVRASEKAFVQVQVDAANLPPNTYTGSIEIRALGSTQRVLVTLVVAEAPRPRILLTHPSLRFTAVAGGGPPLPQFFGVLNVGEGDLSFRVDVEFLAAERWLRLENASGSLAPHRQAAQVSVRVDPAGLPPGHYNALLRVSDPSGRAPNSPQKLAVYFTVLAPGQVPPPELAPAALVFVAAPGARPGSQSVQIANLGLEDLDYVTARNLPSGQDWLTVAPATGRLARGEQARILVQPDFSNLGPGIYRSNVQIRFSDGTLRTLSVLSLVGNTEGFKAEREQATCTLQTTVESPRAEESPGGVISLRIYSRPVNCSGSYSADVRAIFSNGDPAVRLRDNGNFTFTGSWTPVNRNVASVLITFQIYLIVGNRLGVEDKLHTVRFANSPPPPPIPVRTAIVDSATYQEIPLVAPGSLVTIFGLELAPVTQEAPDLQNLPRELAGTRVELAGRRLALRYVSRNQINAVIPFGLTPDDLQSLVVIRETIPSVPEDLAVAKARPGVFIPDTSQPARGSVLRAADGTLIGPQNPVRRGEEIIILCNGLGAVDQEVEAGTPPPTSPPARVISTPVVLVDGREAPLKSAILNPAGGGGYEVRAIVPLETRLGDDVPLQIRAAGQNSPPVLLSVK
ncbi:MAG: hypothetical protein NZV14_03505 [Bryobacteraceae bacterium]|nr:hypothetical protein [Bryobacteraceae bacterium]MDW8377203.1 hypothetical protein [Bryobacterales bacterium]